MPQVAAGWVDGARTFGGVQVSRLFSALLQLANNGNVILLRGSDPSQPFSLQLASLDRPHQQFEDYRAPSFLQNKVLCSSCCGAWECNSHSERCIMISEHALDSRPQMCRT